MNEKEAAVRFYELTTAFVELPANHPDRPTWEQVDAAQQEFIRIAGIDPAAIIGPTPVEVGRDGKILNGHARVAALQNLGADAGRLRVAVAQRINQAGEPDPC